MVALVPVHETLAVADVLQRGLEVARVMRARRRQHGLAEGDAIEGVVAHDELFRPARPADQRVAHVARAAQRGRNEIDALRNRRQGLRRRDQARHARFAGSRGHGANRQGRAACEPSQDARGGWRRAHSRTTTSRSVPDSAPQTSPGRPSSWRTEAPRLLLGKLSNFSVAGSKRTIALARKSVSQTLSLSST